MLRLVRVFFLAGVCMCGFVFPVLAGNNSGQAFTQWPDTGQTKCYNDTVQIPCPAAGQAFYGQDAQYTGPARSYTNLGSGMIRDNVTGLIWEQKTNKDDVQNYSDPHDADNTYTWCDPNPNTNGGNAGTCGDHDTQDFIDQLNNSNYGGHHDWRLPTIKELATLVDLGRINSAIDPVFNDTTVPSSYWSSSTVLPHPLNSDHARRVHFGGGNSNTLYKSDSYYVRAMRCGQ